MSFIKTFAEELTRAADDLSAGKVRPPDASALRERLGAPDVRGQLHPEELAAVLVELRRPGLATCALAELLHEREQRP